MAHQTLRTQWFEHPWPTKRYAHKGFEHPWRTKRYAYNGLSAHGAPNVTHRTVSASMAHRTFRIQYIRMQLIHTQYEYTVCEDSRRGANNVCDARRTATHSMHEARLRQRILFERMVTCGRCALRIVSSSFCTMPNDRHCFHFTRQVNGAVHPVFLPPFLAVPQA